MNNGHPTNLIAFDPADIVRTSEELYDRIVAAMHSVAIKNKWYFNSAHKAGIKREIIEAGEKRARRFARDHGVENWTEPIIARIDEAPDGPPEPYNLDSHIRNVNLDNWEEVQFRVVLSGNAYERLVSAICAQK